MERETFSYCAAAVATTGNWSRDLIPLTFNYLIHSSPQAKVVVTHQTLEQKLSKRQAHTTTTTSLPLSTLTYAPSVPDPWYKGA